ncbi:MAG: terminase small subunit [Pseudomonas sp.]
MAFLTRKEYGELKGWSRQHISKLVQNERLVLNDIGLIDVAASEQLLAMTSDPSKAGVVARHEQQRFQRGVPTSGEELSPLMAGREPDFQKARAMREHYLALQEQTNFHTQQGTLVERKAVEDAAYSAGRLVRDQLLGLPPRLSPEIAGMTDPWQIERLLTAAIRQALEDADRVSKADLEHAITPS